MKKKENTLLKKFYKILTIIILFLLLLAINFYKKDNFFNFSTIKESKEEKKQVINDEYKLNHLFTKWGESLDKNNILQEYPRPQFVRNSYLNLNGEWDYSLKIGDDIPDYNDKIIVPFPIESPLSGVFNKSLEPGMTLWYKKIINLKNLENKGRFLFHFGAVDQFTEVFINGNKVGEHDGGYNSFYFDITNYIGEDLSNIEIIVKAIDNYDKDGAAFGK